MDQNYLEQLTPAQRAAVEHHTGPAMVLAGPGSGKTRVITYRIAHLIEFHQVRPAEIVAITFTNKAANEMVARAGKMLPAHQAEGLRISTFHSLCARLLRREHENAGLTENYSISDEDDAKAYCIQAIATVAGKDPKEVRGFKDHREPNRVRRYISDAKQKVWTPDVVMDNLMHSGATEIDLFYGQVYDLYQRLMDRNNCVDFDDLIMKTVLMFRKHDNVRSRFANYTKQLLVDEYQDTNQSQYELVRHLSSVHGNVFVVGDVDQSIYAFRGAEPRNLNRMEDDYGDQLQTFFLEENFRSTPQIADVSNNLIGNNTERKPKLIKPVAKDGPPVRILQTNDHKQEAAVVVQEIMDAVQRGKHSYKDFAILYRIHQKSRLFEELFVAMNVPHRVIGGVGFYHRAIIKDLLAYLKLLMNGADEASFLRIYSTPPRHFGDVAYAKICMVRNDGAMPIMHVFRDKLYEEVLTGKALAGAEKIRNLYLKLHSMSKDKVAPIIEAIIKETGFRAYIEQSTSKKEEKGSAKLKSMDELLIAAKEFDDDQNAGLLRFLEWVALVQAADKDGDDDKVRLMTCHAAKGLEYPNLYVVGAIDGLMPMIKMEDNYGRPKSSEQLQADQEEERRVFFVALTRAEKRLSVVWHTRQVRYGQKVEECYPSPFIQEMGDTVDNVNFMNTNIGSRLIGILNRRKGGQQQSQWKPRTPEAGQKSSQRYRSRY